jgi:branched-chain amino acid transport system substrate-binding protein
MDLPFYAVGGSANTKLVELAGQDAAEGARNVAGKLEFVDYLADSDPQKAVIQRYSDQYMAAFGTVADQFGGHADDAFRIAVHALEQVGPDRAAIRDQLEAMNYAGCSGLFQWSATDHAGMAVESLVRIQVKDGRWQLVQ